MGSNTSEPGLGVWNDCGGLHVYPLKGGDALFL